MNEVKISKEDKKSGSLTRMHDSKKGVLPYDLRVERIKWLKWEQVKDKFMKEEWKYSTKFSNSKINLQIFLQKYLN